MANVINRTTLQYLQSVNTPDYSSIDWIINPVLPNCLAKYWKIVGDLVLEMTQEEKDAVDLAEAQAEAQRLEDLKDFIVSFEKLNKAFALVVLDEFNVIRNWIESFKTEVDNSISLADFKTRISNLPSMNDRTVDQLKTAVKNKYDEL